MDLEFVSVSCPQVHEGGAERGQDSVEPSLIFETMGSVDRYSPRMFVHTQSPQTIVPRIPLEERKASLPESAQKGGVVKTWVHSCLCAVTVVFFFIWRSHRKVIRRGSKLWGPIDVQFQGRYISHTFRSAGNLTHAGKRDEKVLFRKPAKSIHMVFVHYTCARVTVFSSVSCY